MPPRKQPLKRTGRLAPASKKQSVALREYAKLKARWLPIHPWCEIGWTCNGYKLATEVHHTKLRGPNLNKTETWRAACSACHHAIHNIDPKRARAEGLLP